VSATSATTTSAALADHIEMIQDAVELPYPTCELFTEPRLPPPKGILLYAPPGCGNRSSPSVPQLPGQRVSERTGRHEHPSFFLNIRARTSQPVRRGTERQIRHELLSGPEKSDERAGHHFFDRWSRVSAPGALDHLVHRSTICAALRSEIDGVESLKNVIVIGAPTGRT